MADAIQFNVDGALAKLGELVAKHGPDAVNLAAQVVQITAVQTLLSGIAAAALLGGSVKTLGVLVRKAKVAHGEDDFGLPLFGWSILAAADVIAGTVALTFTLGNLLDVWAWVALFNPKLALAHQVLAKFVGG